jgi:LEA14-like dessication related protein
MLRLIALSLVVISFTVVAQPKLEVVGGDTYNWGQVKPSANPLKGTLKLKNAGNQPLEIKSVKPSCGCTATKLDKEILQPGEVASVDVSLNIGTATGQVTKTITISSNDPNNETKIVWLKAEVVRAIMLSMPYIAFTDLNIGKESTASITVKNNSSENVTFFGFEGTAGLAVTPKGKLELKPGEEFKLSATLVPDKEGYYSGTVKFSTSHPDFPSVEVPVYGNVLKPTSPVFQPGRP